jgi:hypothetical protein
MELVRSAAYPNELWALLKFRFGGGKSVVMPQIEQVSIRADCEMGGVCKGWWHGVHPFLQGKGGKNREGELVVSQ